MQEPTYRYTRHQVPRGTLPDAQNENAYYLFKNVSVLHATYQVRLLAYHAFKTGKKLVIQVPQRCRKAETLRRLMKDNPNLIRFEKVP
jgi:hypothetical protein